jgi:peptidyl-prolyl cis-trans isomerase B (cyclophilin B)
MKQLLFVAAMVLATTATTLAQKSAKKPSKKATTVTTTTAIAATPTPTKLTTPTAETTNNNNKNNTKVMSNTPAFTHKIKIETSMGTMIAILYDETPAHRDNMVKLAKEGYYNDLLFHRVIKGFMVQGGDPQSRGASASAQLGSGGPGYTVPAEIKKGLFHKKGALSAARQGDQVNPERRSSGSQFYVVQGNVASAKEADVMAQRGFDAKAVEAYKTVGGTPFLDNQYTVFGEVIEGLDVIDKIAAVQTQPGDRPVTDLKMKITLAD